MKRKPRRAELGLSVAEYDALLAAQGGGCAICGAAPQTERPRRAWCCRYCKCAHGSLQCDREACSSCGKARPALRRLDVDHDHTTGKVRGLLDHRCNRALPDWMTRAWLDGAFRYLARNDLAERGRLIYSIEGRGYSSPCWIWQRALSSTGYAVIRYQGETRYVHRLMVRGLIPDGYHVDHLCVQRACVNPEHLEAVTPGENSRRATSAAAACKRGHPWTVENTYYRPDATGHRQCRACIKIRTAIAADLRRARRG